MTYTTGCHICLSATRIICLIHILAFVSCNPKRSREANNVQINIATKGMYEVMIDDRRIALSDSIQELKFAAGQHILKMNDRTLTFDIQTNEHVLINPSMDTIVMEEVLYETVLSGSTSDGPQHYRTPVTIFSLGRLKYAGPYKVFANESIIKGWDFGINRKPSRRLTWDSTAFKSAFSDNYFKINTLSVFRNDKIPLNFINEWIEQKVQRNMVSIKEGYKLSVEQSNFLVVTSSKRGIKVSVGKVAFGDSDDLEITKANIYNKTEHGTVTSQIAVIRNCIMEGDRQRKKRQMEIVLSDKSHQPHIRITSRRVYLERIWNDPATLFFPL